MTRAYKLTLLTSLYLAQGLPYGFFTQALPVLMREQGMSLKAISATSLLFLPWALKFLWAPFVDHVGTRRQWLLPLQWTAVLGAALLAMVEAHGSFMLIFAALFVFNVLAAAQDVATDGLGVRLLSERERGLGNGIQVGAYRVGMILGGGLLLWVFAKTDWPTMFLGMALLLALSALPVLWLREPPPLPATQRPHRRALLSGWLRRAKVPGMGLFLLLVCAYKFGDTMTAALVGPYMRDSGLSKEEIALIKGTAGSMLSLLGAALGGWLAFRAGRRFALLACGLAQTASLSLYVLAALGIGGTGMIWAACSAEHLFGAMAMVALFTLMMDASDPEHASTDYTLLACAVVVAQGTAHFAGAAVADAFGYATTFTTGLIASGLGCLLLVAAVDAQRGPQRLQEVWKRA